jgi:hypothetical protein
LIFRTKEENYYKIVFKIYKIKVKSNLNKIIEEIFFLKNRIDSKIEKIIEEINQI